MEQRTTRQKGLQAEDFATSHLQGAGYAILSRNFNSRDGELDIVALDDDTVVFIEVKARRSITQAFSSVSASKQKKLRLAAEKWLLCNPSWQENFTRFDLMIIMLPIDSNVKLFHLKDAFRPEG